MKYVSWNCRGLGRRLKEEALKDIVRMYSPEILLIQETKLEDFFSSKQEKNYGIKAKEGLSAVEATLVGLPPSGTAPNMI